jgi:hypothetical protein
MGRNKIHSLKEQEKQKSDAKAVLLCFCMCKEMGERGRTKPREITRTTGGNWSETLRAQILPTGVDIIIANSLRNTPCPVETLEKQVSRHNYCKFPLRSPFPLKFHRPSHVFSLLRIERKSSPDIDSKGCGVCVRICINYVDTGRQIKPEKGLFAANRGGMHVLWS